MRTGDTEERKNVKGTSCAFYFEKNGRYSCCFESEKKGEKKMKKGVDNLVLVWYINRAPDAKH